MKKPPKPSIRPATVIPAQPLIWKREHMDTHTCSAPIMETRMYGHSYPLSHSYGNENVWTLISAQPLLWKRTGVYIHTH